MEKKLSILQITDKENKYISTLCQWMMDWWGWEEGFSQEKMQSYLCHSLCENRLPQTFLLLVDGEPAGMYQLSVTDIDVRPDIYPWLINVYIHNPFRGNGLFAYLMKSIYKQGKILGFPELFLFTYHEGLYEKFGWEYVEEFDTFIEGHRRQRLYHWKIHSL